MLAAGQRQAAAQHFYFWFDLGTTEQQCAQPRHQRAAKDANQLMKVTGACAGQGRAGTILGSSVRARAQPSAKATNGTTQATLGSRHYLNPMHPWHSAQPRHARCHTRTQDKLVRPDLLCTLRAYGARGGGGPGPASGVSCAGCGEWRSRNHARTHPRSAAQLCLMSFKTRVTLETQIRSFTTITALSIQRPIPSATIILPRTAHHSPTIPTFTLSNFKSHVNSEILLR